MPEVDSTPIAIDEHKLNQMKYMILDAERTNNNTRMKTNDGMVELIAKTIKNVADRTY